MSIPTVEEIVEDLSVSAEVGSPYTYETVDGSVFVQTYDENGAKGLRYPLTVIVGEPLPAPACPGHHLKEG